MINYLLAPSKKSAGNISLTTDESENERANRFYAKCGFGLLDTFKRPGKRIMNRWIMKLT